MHLLRNTYRFIVKQLRLVLLKRHRELHVTEKWETSPLIRQSKID